MLCFMICSHFMFTVVITLLIIANTIVLATDSYPEVESVQSKAELLNNIFTYCFMAEMVIKLIGLGFKEYARDSFNIFDASIVILSIIEIALEASNVTLSTGGAFSAFRGIRLLRVFKLARSWTSFRDMLAKIIVTIKDVSSFLVLLLICMSIFTLLGMELFGKKVKYNSEGETITDDDSTE